jgi:hypothetical protein
LSVLYFKTYEMLIKLLIVNLEHQNYTKLPGLFMAHIL